MWLLLRTPLGKRLIVGVMLFALFCVSVVVALIAAWVGAGPSSEGCAPKKADDEIVQVASGPLTNGVKTAARAAVGAGWDSEDAVTAVAIAGAESGYNREAANSQSTARGMWQIMLSYHQPKFEGADWRDPYANARVAYQIWKARGSWVDWTVHTSGAYRKHLPEARQAVAEATRTGIGGTGPNDVLPVAQTAANFIRQQFRFKGDIGGRATGGHITGSKHYTGLAIDVMTGDNKALGKKLYDYFAGPGYKAFGVDNVIHNHRIYNAGRGDHAYSGENPHTGHVHVDFHAGAGTAEVEPPAVEQVATEAETPECIPSGEPITLDGDIVHPVKEGARITGRHGDDSSVRSSIHKGLDFGEPCGTPVKAAHPGTIQVDAVGWAGQLVRVNTGPGELSTWYAHMQTVSVRNGEQVQAGQKIGEIGREGNSTGCHLHFEVHPNGGEWDVDDIDPEPWLKEKVGKTTEIVPVNATNQGGEGFGIASFNVLGSSHRANGPQRVQAVPGLFDTYGVSVAGLQEFQRNQAAAFKQATAGEWDMFHPPGDTENAIVWRTSQFTRTGQGWISVPYFNNDRRKPWVSLRDSEDNTIIVLNVHNPASGVRGMGDKSARRAEAVRRELAKIAELRATTGLPVFWTGDMNARPPELLPQIQGGPVQSAHAGNKQQRIDWILATPDVRFTGWQSIRNNLIRQTSDHPLVTARATTN